MEMLQPGLWFLGNRRLLTPTAAPERLLHLLGWQVGGLDGSVGGTERERCVGTLCRDLRLGVTGRQKWVQELLRSQKQEDVMY